MFLKKTKNFNIGKFQTKIRLNDFLVKSLCCLLILVKIKSIKAVSSVELTVENLTDYICPWDINPVKLEIDSISFKLL